MMEETDIQRRMKALRIKIRKVEGKIKYNNQDLLNIFSESKFEDRVKTITVAFEDCEDDLVGLVVDLEEENEPKHKQRIDDLNRKLENLRNAVSAHEKESIARRTEPNNDTMDPEPVSQAFSEDDQEDTTARQSVSTQAPSPSPQKETFQYDKNSAVSHISSPSLQPHIQDSTTIHTPDQQIPMEFSTERLTCEDTNNVAPDPEYMNKDDRIDNDDDGHNIDDDIERFVEPVEQKKVAEKDTMTERDAHGVHTDMHGNVAWKADRPQISSEKQPSAQPENIEKECPIINTNIQDKEHHDTKEDDESMDEVIFGNENAEHLVATINPQSNCHRGLNIELSDQPHPENTAWITVKGVANLEFIEFGDRYKFYKCLSRACAGSKTLVVTKGVNRNSFHLHCKQKHRLEINSIRRRTGEIISIKKPRCSKCEKEFSRKQTHEDHEKKCKTDLKKGGNRRRSKPLLDEQEHSSSSGHTQNASHSEEIGTSNQKVRNIKRKKGISKDKKTVPKKTRRTDTADVPEVNTNPKNILSTSSHPSSYSVARASDECSEAEMQSNTNGVDNLSMNTQPASQAADLGLEEVPSSSPDILRGYQRQQTHPDEDVSSPKTSESQTSNNSLAGHQKESMGEVKKEKGKKGISKDKQSVPKKVLNTNTAEVNTHPQEIMRTSSPPGSCVVQSPPDSKSSDKDCQRRQTHPDEDVSSPKTSESKTSNNSLAGNQNKCRGYVKKVKMQKRKKGISKDKQSVPKKVLNTNTAEVNTHPQEIIRTSSPPDSCPVPSPPDSERSDNGMESNTTRFENYFDDLATLNTPPAIQIDLEELTSSEDDMDDMEKDLAPYLLQ